MVFEWMIHRFISFQARHGDVIILIVRKTAMTIFCIVLLLILLLYQKYRLPYLTFQIKRELQYRHYHILCLPEK